MDKAASIPEPKMQPFLGRITLLVREVQWQIRAIREYLL